MKRLLFTAQLLCLFSFCFSQEKFTINGIVKNVNPEKVFIGYYSVAGSFITDSAIISNGKFSVNGILNGPTIAVMSFSYNVQGKSQKKHHSQFFLDKGTTEIIRDSAFVSIKGSKAQDIYLSFTKKFEPIEEEMKRVYDEYYRIYSQKDTTGMEQITMEKDNLDRKIRAIYRDEFLRDPSSPIAVQMLYIYASPAYERDGLDIDTLYAKLPLSAKSTSAGIDLEKTLSPIILCRVGNIAPEFVQNDTAGAPISLSSFRGKYVLLDFWASWCGPCRKENPFYVASFKKYSGKGFQIISVSLDEDKIAWTKAIHKDNLNWTHVSDLKSFENVVAVQYGIRAIPRNFLIDPAGKIIAKDLRGTDLEQMLGKLLQ